MRLFLERVPIYPGWYAAKWGKESKQTLLQRPLAGGSTAWLCALHIVAAILKRPSKHSVPAHARNPRAWAGKRCHRARDRDKV